jgi:hypothetical protein
MEIQGDQTSILLDFFSKAGYKDVKRGWMRWGFDLY